MLRKKGLLYEISHGGKIIGQYQTKSQANGAEAILRTHIKEKTVDEWLEEFKVIDMNGRKIAVLKSSTKFDEVKVVPKATKKDK